MNPIGKSFSSKGLQNLLLTFEGIRCEKKVDDRPRRVSEYHYCESIPRPRNNPHLSGLAKRVVEMLGYDEK